MTYGFVEPRVYVRTRDARRGSFAVVAATPAGRNSVSVLRRKAIESAEYAIAIPPCQLLIRFSSSREFLFLLQYVNECYLEIPRVTLAGLIIAIFGVAFMFGGHPVIAVMLLLLAWVLLMLDEDMKSG